MRDRPSAGPLDVEALRDHAGALLDVIVADLEKPQTEQQRSEKASGESDGAESITSAASQHGVGRAASGITVDGMLAEFRALRASVIGLWREQQQHAGPEELEELTRFNEAIDQAIAESMSRYTREVDTARGRFFAVLGHDLRTPLGVIQTSSQFLLQTAQLTEAQRTVVMGMERSGRRMTELVRDLLDLALTGLGTGIPIERAELDLGEVARDVVTEVAESRPGSRIDVETRGMLVGAWDRARLAQALINLVGNAVQHGSANAPIKVVVNGEQRGVVTVSINNQGPPIPRERVGGLFDAMKGSGEGRDRRHLGLGLYIVDKIVDAHGGSIDVRSSEAEGTTFVVSLPRGTSAG